LTGDTDHPFTACDLKCNIEIGQEIAVPDDTYKGCSFPSFDWYVSYHDHFIMNGYAMRINTKDCVNTVCIYIVYYRRETSILA